MGYYKRTGLGSRFSFCTNNYTALCFLQLKLQAIHNNLMSSAGLASRKWSTTLHLQATQQQRLEHISSFSLFKVSGTHVTSITTSPLRTFTSKIVKGLHLYSINIGTQSFYSFTLARLPYSFTTITHSGVKMACSMDTLNEAGVGTVPPPF